MDAVHLLIQFGLTHQEAKLYTCLHSGGPATGYELAKASGVSRSNTYAGLSSLVEKGGAWLIDGTPACYQAVPPGEFCGNAIRALEKARTQLEKQLPAMEEDSEGYLTIKGEKNIRDKIENMIQGTRKHIYLAMTADVLETFRESLAALLERGCKVVAVTDRAVESPGLTVYRTLTPAGETPAIRVISDTRAALTGSLADGPGCSCLYSRKGNLVSLLRDSMANEIKLIQMTGDRNQN